MGCCRKAIGGLGRRFSIGLPALDYFLFQMAKPNASKVMMLMLRGIFRASEAPFTFVLAFIKLMP